MRTPTWKSVLSPFQNKAGQDLTSVVSFLWELWLYIKDPNSVIWDNIIKTKGLKADRTFTYTGIASVLDLRKKFLGLLEFENNQLSFH